MEGRTIGDRLAGSRTAKIERETAGVAFGGMSDHTVNEGIYVPDGKFNYKHVAIWENESVYRKAHEKGVTPMKAEWQQLEVEMTPVLFHVAFEY